MRFQPLPVMTVVTVVSLVILGMLGQWQWARYQDKTARADAPPLVFDGVSYEIDAPPGAQAQLVYGLVGGGPVWRRYAPARPVGGGDLVMALVDVVAETEPAPLALDGLGVLDRASRSFERPVSRGSFALADRPEENIWHTFDAAAMAAQYGVDAAGPVLANEPQTITVNGRPTLNPFASPEPEDPLPPARHLGYALTWWGIGAGLIGVYLVYHHSRGRLRFRRAA
ncbi:MAG: SURF1 family cytochrome oxidase biogenesis protein [Pseudomonadota bacterium]